MKKGYNPSSIEPKWQKAWQKSGYPKGSGKKEKFYILDMFPYPSGDGLHVGHVENFTATDIYSRFKRYQGFDVLRPMGWDAFGLPAENFAIKTQIHPSKKTLESIKNFKRQMKSIGLLYDWDREINTSSPEYYKWTQWMFLFLYQNGLAYKKKAKVNWCDSCQTVLANEQVIDGKCDRSGDIVVQKDLEQWFFKITDFINDQKSESGKKITGLLNGLNKVDWPSSTKLAQKHWIGRSEGSEVKFFITDTEDEVTVFTTRLDTIFGCTYIVVAPEHELIQNHASLITNKAEVKKYIEKAKRKTDLERTELNKIKTGVELQGIQVAHPFTGRRLPVYVADYVLGTYGTGAVMGVPAHDERDFEFATKYDLEIKVVVAPNFVLDGENAPRENVKIVERRTVSAIIENAEGKILLLNEGKEFYFPGGGIEDGESAEKAIRREIQEETGFTDVIIEKVIFQNLFCYGFRQSKDRNNRSNDIFYHVKLLSEKAVKSEADEGKHQLFWEDRESLEKKITWKHHGFVWQSLSDEACFTDDGILVDSGEYDGLTSDEARKKMTVWLEKEKLGKKKVNSRLRDWLISRQRYWGAPIPIIYCETCGAVPVPEKDLPVKLPTDVDFQPTGESPLARSKSFHKVKCPQCGAKARRESDTMDTFVCSSWYYLRFADPKNTKQFASKKMLEKYLPVDFYMGGAEHTVLHLLYARFFTKALMLHGYLSFDEPFLKLRHQGTILAEDGNKMSKSKGNVVNPDQIVEEFGADSLRLYEMFMGPLEDMKAWNTKSIIGLRRFLEKIWKLEEKVSEKTSRDGDKKNIESLLHKTIKKVTDDAENLKFNTAISALMILVNELEKETHLSYSAYRSLLVLLSPFAPHIAEELWTKMGEKKSIFSTPWPKYEMNKMTEESVKMVVQVNGKLRALLSFPANVTEQEVKKAAEREDNVSKQMKGKTIKKTIFVPGKLINFVVI